MALVIDGKSCCPICDKAVHFEDGFYATSGVFFEPDSPLFPYCDAAIHWDCLLSWEMREQFFAGYFRAGIESNSSNPYWARVYLDENLFITMNSNFIKDESLDNLLSNLGCSFEKDNSGYIDIRLKESGTIVRIDLDLWEGLVSSDFAGLEFEYALEKEAFFRIMPLLREKFATAKALSNAADIRFRKRLYRRQCREERREKREVERKLKAYNKRAAGLYKKGLDCIHCGNGDDIRFMDGNMLKTFKKSYYICRTCGRSFRPDELES